MVVCECQSLTQRVVVVVVGGGRVESGACRDRDGLVVVALFIFTTFQVTELQNSSSSIFIA